MITNTDEYESACEELADLEAWLDRLRRDRPPAEKGLTKAGIRKMIARLHEELGIYEASLWLGKVPCK
jgi:hypothetical protein